MTIINADFKTKFDILLNYLDEIIRKITDFLDNMIKIEEIPFIDAIIENQTPSEFI